MLVHETPARTCAETTAAILFADLCGFTEYTWRHGDERGADLATAFHRHVRALAEEEGCRVIKSIGDAVMVHSADCRTALRLAHRIVGLGRDGGYPPIRAGIDRGPVVERDGDWYGSTVNAAARVTAAAGPGELLLTQRARNAVVGASGIELAGRGLRNLKGLPAVCLHAVLAA